MSEIRIDGSGSKPPVLDLLFDTKQERRTSVTARFPSFSAGRHHPAKPFFIGSRFDIIVHHLFFQAVYLLFQLGE